MMILRRGLPIVVAGLALSSCSFRPEWNKRVWQAGDSEQALPRPSHLESSPIKTAKLNGLEIQLQEQYLGDVRIEGSYRKTVARDGDLRWVKARHVEGASFPSLALLKTLENQSRVEQRSNELQDRLKCRWTSAPEPVLRGRGRWRMEFDRRCEARDGSLSTITLNPQGRPIRREVAGLSFAWTERSVQLYPRGPKASRLESRALAVSTDPYYLFTPTLQIISDGGFRFADITTLGTATPEAETFDLVQSYFYATETLNWIRAHFGFESPGLKIRTHVGYPERGNVAFYYDHEIRLGAGDGITFTHIPWDPSIVTHETMHEMVESLTGLPFVGEGGSLQEALADFLTAMQLNNPAMGESAYRKASAQRTLDNNFRLPDRNGGLYHDSLIVSGTLWEMHGLMGEAASENLVAYLLARLAPDSGFNDFESLVRGWLREECSKDLAVAPTCIGAASAMDRRGWP